MKQSSHAKIAIARSLYNDKMNTITAICTTLGISRATPYRALDAPANGDDATGIMPMATGISIDLLGDALCNIVGPRLNAASS